MIFDSYGFPRDTGASDFGDSSRLAGLLAMIDHPQQIDVSLYVKEGVVTRHPYEPCTNNPNNITRDQVLPLCAGLKAQGGHSVIRDILNNTIRNGWQLPNTDHWCVGEIKKFPDFPDILSPSAKLALELGARNKVSIFLLVFGYLWLFLDIIFSAFSKKLEINQLLATIYLINPKMFKVFKLINKIYTLQLKNYWEGWRNEPQFCKNIIFWIEKF